jgi:hypothetical protein
MLPGDVLLCPYFVRNPLRYHGQRCGDLVLSTAQELIAHVLIHLRRPQDAITHPVPASQPEPDEPNERAAQALESFLGTNIAALGNPSACPSLWYDHIWRAVFGSSTPYPERLFFFVRRLLTAIYPPPLQWFFLASNLGVSQIHWNIGEHPWQIRPQLRDWDRTRFMPAPDFPSVATGPSYTCPFYLSDPVRYQGGGCGDRLLQTTDAFFHHLTAEHAAAGLSAEQVAALEALRTVSHDGGLPTLHWLDEAWMIVFGRDGPAAGRPGNDRYNGYLSESYLWQLRHALYPNSVPFFLLAENRDLPRRERRALTYHRPAWMVQPRADDDAVPAQMRRDLENRLRRDQRRAERELRRASQVSDPLSMRSGGVGSSQTGAASSPDLGPQRPVQTPQAGQNLPVISQECQPSIQTRSSTSPNPASSTTYTASATNTGPQMDPATAVA